MSGRRAIADVVADIGQPALIAVGVAGGEQIASASVLAIVDGYAIDDGSVAGRLWASAVNRRVGAMRGVATTARALRAIAQMSKAAGTIMITLQDEIVSTEPVEHDDLYEYSIKEGDSDL